MGKIHDQKNHDRSPVFGSDQGAERIASDAGDSARGFGVGQASSALRAGAGFDCGSNLAGGSPRLGSVPGTECSSDRVRASKCDLAGAPSVHREKVAAGTQKNGILNMNSKLKPLASAILNTGFKMKTLANAIQKGGQGKTFATCHLAFDGAARGLRVVVIDLDPQGNASHTLEHYASGLNSSQLYSGDVDLISSVFADRDNSGISLIGKDLGLANIEKMKTEDASASLRMQIEKLSEYFDLCLIDTPPFISNLLASALYASDYVMSPVEAETYSMQGIQAMVAVIQNMRVRGNPGLQFIGMFPNRVNYRDQRQLDNLASMRAAFKDLVMPFDCRSRGSFAEALGDQIPVWDIKKSAARVAAKEVRVMTQFVFEKMEVVQ